MSNSRHIYRAIIGFVIGTACSARADLTGPYAGQLVVPRSAPADAAGTLTQSGRTLNGTVVLGTSVQAANGAYLVTGSATKKHFRLTGFNASGVRLVWSGTVKTDGVAGAARVRGPQVRLKGKLKLTRTVSQTDGSGCDAVFNQNQAFFTTQVMGQVLVPICAACHVDGGQAQATRLRVMRADPLATARSTALLIDRSNPGASLLLQKPLAAVPHGGGQQVVPGSPEEQILQQWITLVTQAQCTAAGGAPATNLFAQDCAGCHGVTGAGGASGPDIRCAVKTLLADAVRRGRGRNAMPAFPDADVTTLAAYLHTQCTGQPKDVYAANCANCHGITGGGGRNADGISGPNVRCSEGGDLVEAVRGGADRMPAFPALTGSQITGLARYVDQFCSLGGGQGDG
jgi:mono/diheme cytochrome c family protein